jgi:hypothetical protein
MLAKMLGSLPQGTTLDEVCMLLMPNAQKQRKRSRSVNKGEGVPGRHVKWKRETEYKCVKVATLAIANASHLDALWREKRLCYEHVTIFYHCEADKLGVRSALNPIWEAVYQLRDSQTWVRVQKCHLQHIYNALKRTDKQLAWTILEDDGLPYWVDRYAASATKHK